MTPDAHPSCSKSRCTDPGRPITDARPPGNGIDLAEEASRPPDGRDETQPPPSTRS
jgi:hypothetical protein